MSSEINNTVPADDAVIRVSHVSKIFEMYEKPRHHLQQMMFGRWKRWYKEFRALDDVSFEVKKGEAIGVIGKNGAGKSTLLQILVQTLQPTTGSVEVRGRVAALLELGSGFNPEFTGRENVYMNASILGLSKEQTDASMPKILEFADIGEFIDQPVKAYSSGMMVRLAFAVQVMVKPDILIVDEALAVGDAAFQRKCYARMEELIAGGTTILYVTHNTNDVMRFCKRVIYLKDHKLIYDGNPKDGIQLYLNDLYSIEMQDADEISENTDSEKMTFYGVRDAEGKYGLCCKRRASKSWGAGGATVSEFRIYGLKEPNLFRTPCELRFELALKWDHELLSKKIAEDGYMPQIDVGMAITDYRDIMIYGYNTLLNEKFKLDPREGSSAKIVFKIAFPMLMKGILFFRFAIWLGDKSYHLILDKSVLACKLISQHDNEQYGLVCCETGISSEIKK